MPNSQLNYQETVTAFLACESDNDEFKMHDAALTTLIAELNEKTLEAEIEKAVDNLKCQPLSYFDLNDRILLKLITSRNVKNSIALQKIILKRIAKINFYLNNNEQLYQIDDQGFPGVDIRRNVNTAELDEFEIPPDLFRRNLKAHFILCRHLNPGVERDNALIKADRMIALLLPMKCIVGYINIAEMISVYIDFYNDDNKYDMVRAIAKNSELFLQVIKNNIDDDAVKDAFEAVSALLEKIIFLFDYVEQIKIFTTLQFFVESRLHAAASAYCDKASYEKNSTAIYTAFLKLFFCAASNLPDYPAAVNDECHSALIELICGARLSSFRVGGSALFSQNTIVLDEKAHEIKKYISLDSDGSRHLRELMRAAFPFALSCDVENEVLFKEKLDKFINSIFNVRSLPETENRLSL